MAAEDFADRPNRPASSPGPLPDTSRSPLHHHHQPSSSSILPLFRSNNSSTTSLNKPLTVEESSAGQRTSRSNPLSHLSFRNRRHRVEKSPSSRTSLSSLPVIVRTYSGESIRASSRVRSPTPSSGAVMPRDAKLPSIDAFSFAGILRAVEPDIRDHIDSIAEICARSRLSLADEYGAHLPPQGEILPDQSYGGNLPAGHRGTRAGFLGRTLTTVTEASSSSERLSGGSKPGSATSSYARMTAYGSLRSIISGSTRNKKPKLSKTSDTRRSEGSKENLSEHKEVRSPTGWVISERTPPSVVVVAKPSMTNSEHQEESVQVSNMAAPTQPVLRRPESTLWFPRLWRSSAATGPSAQENVPPNAEESLKDLLKSTK
ncbi:hypothetical protein P152DRAFT_461377 [Eremomyces bilateralis CBS 781.70]|uniref:Uncharacterized protein n=1 Tax=Eremomyces bilateralis CBS 781.70 TaxID=1392243 RepID=A0A6G1FVL1_9PEZI|nr:uncharacterized protein P152DRAFT_461377 [Eremomyces bilateralis CBS 781.70]KAF1809701.1 hypothetical protein P152DRAFT_461377 [Eremomyces bilateralis CBS 781.70]